MGRFEISHNSHLTNVTALSSLISLGDGIVNGYFDIESNVALTSLTGLDNVDYTTMTDLYINNCTVLTYCNVLSICNYLLLTSKPAVISNNATGCDTRAQVENACTPVLPVEMIYFKGNVKGNSTYLTWETASEKNCKNFLIEHSMNDIGLEEIGMTKGHGTTIQPNSYGFVHEKLIKGTHYYRLKQVDDNGNFAYTDIISVHAGSEGITIIPNPTQGPVTISGIEQDDVIIIQVTNEVGTLVKEEGLLNNAFDLSEQPNGWYFITVKTDSQVTTQRLLKK